MPLHIPKDWLVEWNLVTIMRNTMPPRDPDDEDDEDEEDDEDDDYEDRAAGAPHDDPRGLPDEHKD